jgi:hypothetical protein
MLPSEGLATTWHDAIALATGLINGGQLLNKFCCYQLDRLVAFNTTVFILI